MAHPPRRIDWARIAGCAGLMLAAAFMLGAGYALTVWVLSSGQP